MLEILWLLIAVILVMGLAYFVTRYIGGNMPLKPSRKVQGKLLHCVEQMYLGRDRQIILIQAGEKYLLLGNTANQISTLAEFSAEEIEAWREKEGQMGEEDQRMSFARSLQEILKQRGGRYNGD